MKKSIRILVMVLCVMLFVTGCSSSGEAANEEASTDKVFTLKAGHVLQTDHPYHLGLVKFSELAKEKSNGRIDIQVFPASQLGNERDMIEGLQMGSVDISLTATAPVANFASDLLVFDLPYLFRDKEHAYKVLDGDIGKNLFSNLEANGLIGLEFLESGFFVLQNNSKEIQTPEDVVGMKIRTMENAVHMDFFTEIGANATPMAFGEVFTALQNKTLDGGINSLGVIYSTKFHIPAPYITLTQQVYAPSPLMISKKTYDELPEDLQQVIREAATEARDYEREQNAIIEQDILKKMKDEGCIITEVSIDEWSNAVEGVYDNFIPSKINAELVNEIKAVN